MPLTESTKAKERGAGKDIKTSVTSMPLCETHCPSHGVFRSHGEHRGHGGGAEKALKNLCAQFCLSRSSQRTRRGTGQSLKTSVHSVPPCETLYTSHAVLDLTENTEDTERGANKSLKNLCVLRASVRNSSYTPCRFSSHGDHKGYGERSRQILEKTSVYSVPPCEILYTPHAVLNLTEFTEDMKRGAVKALKNLCVLRASVRNSSYTPCRFKSHGDHKGHGERSRQIYKKPLCTPCLHAKFFIHPMPI